jgi:hypothetical protein
MLSICIDLLPILYFSYISSPAISAGDPASDNSRSPWGGRIEMGAYQTPIPSANVSLYYQNGVAYGQTVRSGTDGKFVFSNIPYGNYYVVVDKQLFRENRSSVFNIKSTSIDLGSQVKILNGSIEIVE